MVGIILIEAAIATHYAVKVAADKKKADCILHYETNGEILEGCECVIEEYLREKEKERKEREGKTGNNWNTYTYGYYG